MSTKWCGGCEDNLPTNAFYSNKAAYDGLSSRCKECCKKYDKQRRLQHPDIVKASVQRKLERERQDPVRLAKRDLRNRRYELKQYGLTVEDYDTMFDTQGGVCAICGEPPVNGARLVVDHDHETGKVRGLLCSPCNTAVGRLDAVLDWHIKAGEYIARHKEEGVQAEG